MDPEGGGPVEGIHNSIPALQKLGVFSEVVCLDDIDPAYNKNDVFPVHRLGKGKGQWYYNSKLTGWLKLNAHRFDIIIVHGLWLYHGYTTHKILQQLKSTDVKPPRYFVFPHGMLDPWFQNAPGRKWKGLRNWIYWKLIESKIVNGSDGVIFTSEEEKRLAATTFTPYIPKAEIKLGYGIFSPPEYLLAEENSFRKKISLSANRPFILFLGRIHEKKGLDLLVKSYLLLEKIKKDLPALVIAGPGLSSAYGRSVIELAGKSPNIYFSGFLSGGDKWAALHSCQTFILPSHQENFGIAVVEAMACGKVVLISNKVNIWREIQSSGSGIVGDDSIEGTTKMITDWLELSIEKKKQMGINALDCFHRYFTVEQASKEFFETLINVAE